MSLLPQQQRNRLSIRRQLAPLHQGFGFGAKEIQEESVRVARVATEEKRQKLDQTLDVPLPGSSFGSTLPRFGAQSTSRVPAWSLPPTRVAEAAPQSAVPDQDPALRQVQGELAHFSLPPQSLTVAEHQVLASRLLADAPEQSVVRVGWGAAMLACFFDVTIAMSCVIFVGGMNYSLSTVQATESFAGRLAQVLPFLSKTQVPLIAFALQVYLGAALVILALQAVCAFCTGSSAGRFAVGISLADPGGKSLGARVAIALGEAVSMGGLLTFPLQLLAPGRLPLFPFIRMKRIAVG